MTEKQYLNRLFSGKPVPKFKRKPWKTRLDPEQKKPALLFTWEWCPACRCMFVRCPKCGNNCCNAGFGTVAGKSCDTCNLAYQYQHLAWKTKAMPHKRKRRVPFVLKLK